MSDPHVAWDNEVSDDLVLRAVGPMVEVPVDLDPFDRELLEAPAAQGAYRDARNRRLLVKTFGAFRRALGISQTEMAKRMQTSQSVISDIEKGLKDPRLSTLQKFARALGVDLHINISLGYGFFILTSWNHRAMDYTSSVRPTRIEEGLEEMWMAVLRDRRKSLELEAPMQSDNVKPVSLRSPREDNYVSGRDLFQLDLTQSANAQERDGSVL